MSKPNCAECEEYRDLKYGEWFRYWLSEKQMNYVHVSEKFKTNTTTVRVNILGIIEKMGIRTRDNYGYAYDPKYLKSKVLLALTEKEVIQ